MRVVQFFLVTLIVGIPKARAIDGAVGAGGVRQFLKTHCLRCHGEEKQKGKLALHQVDFDFTRQTPVNCGSGAGAVDGRGYAAAGRRAAAQ